jgi:hypothetical protein
MKLAKWDDYLIHQVVKPMDMLGTDDPNFMDRLWFMAYSSDGKVQMMAGLGSHPNKGIMDGFLLIRDRGTQHNFRASRHIADDKSDPCIGPLRFEIVEPQQHWRMTLAPNEQGIECDLDFHARTAPYLFPPLEFTGQGQLHYKQPGSCTGVLKVRGEEFRMEAVPAVRDRSWGIRKPGIVSGIGVLLAVEAHFASGAATMIYLDTLHESFQMRQGAMLDDDGTVTEVLQMRQAVEFAGADGLFETVAFEVVDAAGKTRTLTAKAISEPCYFTGGGYDGRHGLDCGPLHTEGEEWDLSQAGGHGGVYPYYSRICEFDLDGEKGIGHVEAYFSQEPDWSYQPTLLR